MNKLEEKAFKAKTMKSIEQVNVVLLSDAEDFNKELIEKLKECRNYFADGILDNMMKRDIDFLTKNT